MLCASGVAGAMIPDRVGAALDLPPTSARGRAEARVGLGGTYAALGAYGLLRGGPAQTAVGFTWLGAAVTRVVSLQADEPQTDWTYWAYLAGEIGLGLAALMPTRSRRSA